MKLIDEDKLITHLWDIYCHYACNGRDLNKSAFLNVCLGAVEVQEEIEAIPIEWLHSYIYNFNNFKFNDEREVLKKMIDDWRKENEK